MPSPADRSVYVVGAKPHDFEPRPFIGRRGTMHRATFDVPSDVAWDWVHVVDRDAAPGERVIAQFEEESGAVVLRVYVTRPRAMHCAYFGWSKRPKLRLVRS
jgi:hypothetical protein